jgi:hypothetical protein
MDWTCIVHLMDETYMENIVGYPEGKEDLERYIDTVILLHIKI